MVTRFCIATSSSLLPNWEKQMVVRREQMMRWELEIYVLSDSGVAVVSNSLVTVNLHRYEPTINNGIRLFRQLRGQFFVQTSQKRDTM